MDKIICIEKERNIYKKGKVTFVVIKTPEIWRAVMMDERGENRFYIGREEYEYVWGPILKEHFPNLSHETYYRKPDTYIKGYVVIHETEEITTMNKFLSELSDSPDEFPLTFKDMNARRLKDGLVMFRREIPEGSYLMRKFDSIFPQP